MNIILKSDPTVSNTLTSFQSIFYLTDKQKYQLRQIDPDITDIDIHFQFTTPVSILNNPVITMNGVDFTLNIKGEFIDYAPYATQIIQAMNLAQTFCVFSTSSQIAVTQRTFSISSNKEVKIKTNDYHLCLVTGMQPGIEYTITPTIQQMKRKMWIYYFRELWIICPQIYNTKASDKRQDINIVSRYQYTFQSSTMQTISNTYHVQMNTELACSGISFVFTNEDQTQYLDFENEPYTVTMSFTQSEAMARQRQQMQQMQQRINKLVSKQNQMQQQQQEYQDIILKFESIQSQRHEQIRQMDKEIDSLRQQPQTPQIKKQIINVELLQKQKIDNYKEAEQFAKTQEVAKDPRKLKQRIEEQEKRPKPQLPPDDVSTQKATQLGQQQIGHQLQSSGSDEYLKEEEKRFVPQGFPSNEEDPRIIKGLQDLYIKAEEKKLKKELQRDLEQEVTRQRQEERQEELISRAHGQGKPLSKREMIEYKKLDIPKTDSENEHYQWLE